MIKNAELIAELEKEDIRDEKLTYQEALKIFESMWQEGISLGVLPLKDPLEDISSDIRIAMILNSCSKSL